MTQSVNHFVAVGAWAIVIAAAVLAAIIDVRCRRIPNKLTGPLFWAGLIGAAFAGGPVGLGDALISAAITGLPFIVLWVIAGSGAGDAKMMLAVGVWLSPQHAFVTILAVAIAGGLLSLVYAKAHHRLLNAVANTAWMFLTLPLVLAGPGRLQDRQQLIPASADGPLKTPYSLAILAGTCAACVWVWTCAI